MSKVIEFIEEMRARLNQIAESEQTLVRALADALNRADHQLLQDVRNIATDHESRRGAILHELQGLASRIGTFPAQREPVPGLAYKEPVKPIAAANGNQNPFTRGDWRQAANNIEDELDIFFTKGRAAS